MKNLVLFLASAVSAIAQTPSCTLAGGPAGVQITDTLNSLGYRMNGSIALSLAYTLPDGSGTIVQSKDRAAVINGALSYCAPPNAIITAVYSVANPAPLTGSTVSTRFWIIPGAGGPYRITDIETSTPSTPAARFPVTQLLQGSAADGQCLAYSASSGAWAPTACGAGSAVSTVFGRSGAVAALSGDYTAAKVTNAVDATGSYANPAWITTFPWAKLTGIPSYEPAIAAGTTGQYWRGDKSWQSLNAAAVGLGSVENTALSTWAGSVNVTTLGTIATGLWHGTAIGLSYLPTIPASQTSGFATVATSGLYSDLSGKPTIPTVATTSAVLKGNGAGGAIAATAGADFAASTNGTTGQALTSNAAGGFGTPVTLAASATTDATNASNITTGTLAAARVATLNQSTTGNAATSTALAANGTNCSAGSYPLGVDASGNSEGCTALAAIAASGSATDLTTGTVPAARLPNPSASTLGGVESLASASHQFLTSISTAGVPGQAQAAFTDISGTATAAQVPATVRVRAIGYTFDGGGSALSSGLTKYLTVPFACTISAWNIAVDAGTATLKTWKIATGTAIPTVTQSISTSGVAISSGTAIHSATVSDFTTTAVAANDIVGFNLFAVATATQVNFILECDQ